jgi:dTDP-4-dehydrorhamnose reductase
LTDLTTKILISGASGMLGTALIAEFSREENVEVFYISHSDQFIDKNKNRLTMGDIDNHHFYAFYHCGAEVNVNLCESDFEHAIKSNVYYTKELFKKVNAFKYFYISTDSVYNGKKGNYIESDEVNPVNKYALSKLLGEKEALASLKNTFVIRTNIFGLSSKSKSSLFEWAKRELELGNSINGFTNVYFNPLSVPHLSFILKELTNNDIPCGIYNIGCSTFLSKYDFLVKVAEFIGVKKENILPTIYTISQGLAQRPLNTTLNCFKLISQIGSIDLSIEKSFEDLKIVHI